MTDTERLVWFFRHHESQFVAESVSLINTSRLSIKQIRKFIDSTRKSYDEGEEEEEV